MSWIVRRAVVAGGLATVTAGAVLLFTSGIRARVLDVYVVVLAAVVMLALVRSVRLVVPRRPGSPFVAACERLEARPSRGTVDLQEDRDVVLSRLSSFHYHVRVRPVLRELAAHRLRSRYGVDLDREPARARELVPAAAWEVVRPERPPPADRLARGPSLDDQRLVLEELERL